MMFISRVRIKQGIRELSHLSSLLRNNGYGSHQLLFDLFPASKGRSFLFREEIAKEQLDFHNWARGEPLYYLVSGNEPYKESPLFSVESKPYIPKLDVGDRLAFTLRANPTIARKTAGKKNSIRHDVVMDAQRALLHDMAQMLGISAAGVKGDLKKRILAEWFHTSDTRVTSYLEKAFKENERYEEVFDRKLKWETLFDLAMKAATDKTLESWLVEKGQKNGFLLVRDSTKNRLKFQAEGYRWHALPNKGKTAGFSSVDFKGELAVMDSGLFRDALFNGIGPAKAFGCGLMLVKRIG